MHLWRQLIDQATTMLNLLHPSHINPRLSADAQINGAFDYNTTTFAPPGSQFLVHKKVGKQKTWAPHGVDGWYLVQVPDHYRCHRVNITKTAFEQLANTVQFLPSHCNMPKTSSADSSTEAPTALTAALLNPIPSTPFANIGNKQCKPWNNLQTFFRPKHPMMHIVWGCPAVRNSPTPTTWRNHLWGWWHQLSPHCTNTHYAHNNQPTQLFFQFHIKQME